MFLIRNNAAQTSMIFCQSLDKSITENKEKKPDASIDKRVFEGSAQAERQRGRVVKQGIGRIYTRLAKMTEMI